MLVRRDFSKRLPTGEVCSERGDTLGGALCVANVLVGEEWQRVGSMYVPAGACARGHFLTALEENEEHVQPGDIWQGDMNCVGRVVQGPGYIHCINISHIFRL